jgi:hypothetical protein
MERKRKKINETREIQEMERRKEKGDMGVSFPMIRLYFVFGCCLVTDFFFGS